jgi:hypothetical protein
MCVCVHVSLSALDPKHAAGGLGELARRVFK